MKKLLFLLLMLVPLLTMAYDIDGITYYILADGAHVSSKSSGSYSGKVTIPESIKYGERIYSVTNISACAFSNCPNLTSVTIPNSVTKIERDAFYDCLNLTSVTIGNSVTSIGNSAFEGCPRLTSLTIGNSVTTIGERAFISCSSLSSVTIPNSVTTIREDAFAYCTRLTSVTIGNSVTKIERGTFFSCTSLTGITIPNSVTSIGEAAFEYCTSLTSVNIGNSVTSIEGMAFYGCSNLTWVTIGNSVTTIGDDAFRDCKSLISVTIPNSVTSIGGDAFYGCSSLTSVNIPESVTSIGYGVFYGCKSLISVTIPNSVTTIGGCAFTDCKSLISVTIPNSVTTIGGCAFENCSSLTSVNIPESVTSIGGLAFSRCPSLTSVNIPESVTNIGVDAFKYCPSLPIADGYIDKCLVEVIDKDIKSYSIKEGTRLIVANAFSDCSSLTSLIIPNSVTNICDRAFCGCTGLPSITIPNSVTTIGENIFARCDALTSIVVENSNKNYDSRENCNAIIETSTNSLIAGCKNTIIPNSVTSIGGYAFSHCPNLTSVTIPNSVTSIGNSAFCECSGLTSINIPDSVTSIGIGAFDGCKGLTSIDIPNSVTSIGRGAFRACINLSLIISEIKNPFRISEILGAVGNDIYDTVTLFVPYSSIDLYQTTEGWRYIKNIVPYNSYGKKVSLSIYDGRNQDIANQVSILWYNTSAKQIGSGNCLNGIEEGDTVYYSIQLNEILGRKYREVIMQQVTVGADTESLTCTLKKIPRIELKGRVSATDIDRTSVTVTVKQMLNGKYEQMYSTQADEQGQFKIEVYDDVTDITLSGEMYFDATLHRDGFAGNGNVGTIPMNLLSGFAIAANITLKKAKTAEAVEDITELSGGHNNIEFSICNATKGKELSDFTIQNGSLIIKSNASIGDEIRLMAKSKQGIFAEAATTFTIEEGANSFALELTELGGIDVTYAASSNGKTVGYLYDANNALVAKGSYVGDNLSLRHLPSGNYTLVTMGNSALLGNLTNLSDLNSIGMNEGSDYITASIAVTDGVLSASSINEVPRMDDSRFYYTSNNAYFSANKATVTAGNYIALSAHVDMKPQYQDKVDDVLVTVELPEGCQLVENSVIANRQAVAYTYSGNKLMMNLNKDQWQGDIRFCVIPVLNQTYAITALASFDIDGGVSQPIGTARFESKGLSLDTPSQTADTNITINGTAKGKSDVSIYDNDVFIGKTTSKADGTWTASCELYKTFSHSFHNIYAKVKGENGLELTSETKQVEYDKNNITPKSVTMTFYNGWYKENKTVEFNLIEGTTFPNSYPFYSAADFTFLADFSKNDSTMIKNVNIKVLNSDGTVRTIPATFDGKQNKWVATTKYSSSRKLPQNVTVEYDYIPQEETDDWRAESILDQATVLANCANQIQKFFEDKEATVIEDEDDHLTMEYMFDDTTPVRMRIENMDYADAERMMKEVQFVYEKTDDGIIGTYTEDTENEVLVIGVSIEQKSAWQIKMTLPLENAKIRVRKAPSIPDMISVAGLVLDIVGTMQYWDVRSDFDFVSNLIAGYTDSYNAIRSRIVEKISAKCPDGSYRLENPLQREFFYMDMQLISGQEDVFSKKYYDYLRRYQRCLINSLLTDVATFGISRKIEGLMESSKFIGDIATSVSKFLKNRLKTATCSSNIADGISFALNSYASEAINGVASIFDYRNFEKVRDDMLIYAYKQNSNIMNQYIELGKNIDKAYKKCTKENDKDDQDDEPLDEKSDNKPNFSGSGSTGIIDPSGYVYEAVLSNRLEGVTATCYQQTQVEDMYGDITDEAVIWNAEDYSQQNPVKTDKDGFYRWDVPQGMWQVKYEKEGYETVHSGWLPVPPPQLDVNIAMKQSTPPTVKQMRGTESGITIDMTKYMLPASMTAANITVKRNGQAEQGTIEMLNAELAPLSGETYVQKVKFVPNTRFSVTDNVVVTVHKAVESYCSVPMTADHQETVEIESEITDIVVDASVVVPYQGERELRVLVLPKEASAGRKLHVKSSSSMIASVNASDFVIEEDGSATMTIYGELPGGAMFDFEVDGTDVTATSKIQVKNMGNEVMVPTASIPSGESVVKGTIVKLSCDTEGATIYYTLDGSCPCDEEHRILYTEPITITENVTISAIAVVTGMYDSDVAEFKYIVDGTNIDAISFDDNISLYPLPMKDRLNVKVNEKKIEQVTVTNTEGVAMIQSKGKSNIVSLDVHSLPSGIYIISVSTGGKTYARKVIK